MYIIFNCSNQGNSYHLLIIRVDIVFLNPNDFLEKIGENCDTLEWNFVYKVKWLQVQPYTVYTISVFILLCTVLVYQNIRSVRLITGTWGTSVS